MKVTKFGEFKVVKGETDDPKDLWIDIINFDFDAEQNKADHRDLILCVLDHIKEQLQ